MSRSFPVGTTALVIGLVLGTTPVHAQQSLVLNAGYFAVRGEATRVPDDVLVENLNFFDFSLKDFNGGTVGGDWLFGIGDYFDAGVGLGFYQRTVPSVYTDFVDLDGSEIVQDFRLRIVPLTATIRVLPFGRQTALQPYVGAGFGVFNWHYSEVGEFIDFNTFDIFRDRFVADGTNVGPASSWRSPGAVRRPVRLGCRAQVSERDWPGRCRPGLSRGADRSRRVHHAVHLSDWVLREPL